MQFRRVIDNPEGICILHNDPGIAQNLEITEQKSELTITNLIVHNGGGGGLLVMAILKLPQLQYYYVCLQQITTLLINVTF